MNNKMNDNTYLFYDLALSSPKYRVTKSHVIPSSTFKPDSVTIHSKQNFVPLEIKQIGRQNDSK